MKNRRILIADDSNLYRMLIKKALSKIRDVEIVGEAANGIDALKQLEELKPDMLVLDINMPLLDGIGVLKEIQEKKIDVGVIILSSISKQNAKTTIDALNYGAFDFISKPSFDEPQKNMEYLALQLTQQIIFFESRKILSTPAKKTVEKNEIPQKDNKIKQTVTPTKTQISTPQKSIPKHYDLILIGVSTGGPQTLTKIFSNILKPIPIPIIIVQHMPPVFTKSLSESLDKKSVISFKEAEDGDIVQKESAYIAPGGKHLELEYVDQKYKLKITDTEPVNSCKPSVDVLFLSAKEIIKRKQVLFIVLTGMGRDGANGIMQIKNDNATVIAQDETTSVIYGMPKAVIDSNLQDAIMSLDEIIDFLNKLW